MRKCRHVKVRGWATRIIANGKDVRPRLYHCWKKMRQRCQNKKDKDYGDYGGRGISTCEQWNTYSTFRIWAVSSGYRQGLTIDRIDNNGDYEPDNCRWTTRIAQARNTRTNVLTADIVREIRASKEPPVYFKRKYGLRSSHIWNVRQHLIWRDV